MQDLQVLQYSNDRKVADRCTGNGDTDLLVIRQDGRDLRQLTGTPNRGELASSWSPEGGSIAFTACTGSGATLDCELYIGDAHGAERVPLAWEAKPDRLE
jgi:Tol biopolymer transport system component